MSAILTALTLTATRFAAVHLSERGGWTVADLVEQTTIVPERRWDEAAADTARDALNADPTYAVLFQWWAPDADQPVTASGPGATCSAPQGGSPSRPRAAAVGDTNDLCAFCWQPTAPGAWVELRLYDGPGRKLGELALKVCADHLVALRPAYEREVVECRVTRWEPAADYPPCALWRRPEERT